MARTSVKATYALDIASVKALEKIARRWAVSKSEALRRAINAAAAERPSPQQRIAALERLQAELALTPEAARAWEREIRAERRATTPRRTKRP